MVPFRSPPQKKTDLKDTDLCRLTICVPILGPVHFWGIRKSSWPKNRRPRKGITWNWLRTGPGGPEEPTRVLLLSCRCGRVVVAVIIFWYFLFDVTFIIKLSQNVGTYIYIYKSRFALSETRSRRQRCSNRNRQTSCKFIVTFLAW